MANITLIDLDAADPSSRESAVSATVEGSTIRIPADRLGESTGWTLKPEGLCRGEVCVPVRDRATLGAGDAIDLAAFAAALGRPLVAEPDAGVAVLGTAPADRAAALSAGEAPDFALPDLSGKVHRLSDHRGKKVLLVAYASW